MEKTELIERLRKGQVALGFEKKDGTWREMIATLNSRFLPQPYKQSAGKHPDHIVVVWDIEAHGWRSINIDNPTLKIHHFTEVE